MKPQIIHIHGGDPYDSREQYLRNIEKYYNPLKDKKSWSKWIKGELGDSVDMYLPVLPAKENADYDAWKIAFEKIFPVITDVPLTMIGKSLGTIFLVKWLSENDFHLGTSPLPSLSRRGNGSETSPFSCEEKGWGGGQNQKPILSLHLVACVFDGEGIEDEGMANFVLDTEKLQNVTKQVGEIHLWHSTDDPVCPWHNIEKYQQYFPEAILHTFHDREHFGQEEFSELLEQIEKEIH